MLNNMLVLRNILTVAKYTFKEIVQSKVLINTFLIGIGLFVLTYVAYNFTYGEPSRVALDFGMGVLSLSSVGIAIFMGVSLLYDEIENRTLYVIISRPVPRYAFLVGKIAGMISILIINIIILSLITLSLYFFIGGEFHSLILWSIFYTMIESVLVLLIVTMFSLITTKVLSVILSIILYIMGYAIDGAKLLTFVQSNPLLEKLLDAYHFILPGFYKLNLKDFLLYKQEITTSYLWMTSSYGIIYCLGLIFLSIFIFEKKNLD